jgi:hypothetical protein
VLEHIKTPVYKLFVERLNGRIAESGWSGVDELMMPWERLSHHIRILHSKGQKVYHQMSL